jgi:hypothetical protein
MGVGLDFTFVDSTVCLSCFDNSLPSQYVAADRTPTRVESHVEQATFLSESTRAPIRAVWAHRGAHDSNRRTWSVAVPRVARPVGLKQVPLFGGPADQELQLARQRLRHPGYVVP